MDTTTTKDTKPRTYIPGVLLLEAIAAVIAAAVIYLDAHDSGEYGAAAVDLLALMVVTFAVMTVTAAARRDDD